MSTELRECLAMDSDGYVCTLPKGHLGFHLAHSSGTVVVAAWPSEECTEKLVIADISARQKKGLAKYGQTVAQNPAELKEWLQHAYEECLDQAIYLRRAIQEIEKKGA